MLGFLQSRWMVREALDKHQPTVKEGVPVLFNESKARVLNQTRRIVKVRLTLSMA